MKDLSVIKTWSWAFVSFFVILGIDLITHIALHQTEGFRQFFGTAALGTALACLGKSPIYLLHERIWRRIAHRRMEPTSHFVDLVSLEEA